MTGFEPPDGAQRASRDDLEELELQLLLEGVYRRYGFDFREYAPASLRRRVWRRVHAEGETTISGLLERLLHDRASMEFHMQVNAKHFATAFDNLEAVISEQYYGQISDALSTELAKWKDPSITEAAVRAYCEANLTGYKRPKVIEFRNDLPKTPVGKILRRELRDKA